MDRQGREDRSPESLRRFRGGHGPEGRRRRRRRCNHHRRRRGQDHGRDAGVRAISDPAQGFRNHDGAARGPGAHHHRGRGQGDFRGPYGSRPCHRDDHPVGRGGKTPHGRSPAARRGLERNREIRVHDPHPGRYRRRRHAVQLSSEPRLSQGRSGPGGRKRRRRQAGHRHPAVRPQVDGNHAGGRGSFRGDSVCYRIGRGDRGCDLPRSEGAQDFLHRQPGRRRAHLPPGGNQESHHGARLETPRLS